MKKTSQLFVAVLLATVCVLAFLSSSRGRNAGMVISRVLKIGTRTRTSDRVLEDSVLDLLKLIRCFDDDYYGDDYYDDDGDGDGDDDDDDDDDEYYDDDDDDDDDNDDDDDKNDDDDYYDDYYYGPTPSPATASPTISQHPTQAPVTLSPVGSRVSCPEPGEDPFQFSAVDNISIETVSSGNLCTLTMLKTNNEKNREILIPLARSYDSNPWESSPGPYLINFSCNDEVCESSELPDIDEIIIFQLTTFEISARNLKSEDIAARFLEQTTFGPTTETISPWKGLDFNSPSDLDNSFANWLHDQIYSTPLTSHRQIFRAKSSTRSRVVRDSGSPSHPCNDETHWHSYSFSQADWYIRTAEDKQAALTVEKSSDNTMFTLFINGIPRTEVDNVKYYDWEEDRERNLDIDEEYTIGYVDEEIGGFFEFYRFDPDDGSEYYYQMVDGNPPIRFESNNPQLPPNIIELTPQDRTQFFDPLPRTSLEEEFILQNELNEPICEELSAESFPVYIDFTDGNWMAFDPRINIQDNTIEQPIPDGGGSVKLEGSYCSNAPRTFLNKDSCILADSACRDNNLMPDAFIDIDTDALGVFHEHTGRYFYAVEGLVVEDSPCVSETESKWERIGPASNCAITQFQDDTDKTLKEIIKHWSWGSNFDEIRYAWYEDFEGSVCNIEDSTPSMSKDIIVRADSSCWKLVHLDHHTIFDFTEWVLEHPGGSNPITQFAENNNFILTYPHGNEMWRWELHSENFGWFGDLNSEFHLMSVPQEWQSIELAQDLVGEYEPLESNVVVCGSPFEVTDDKNEGDTGISFFTGFESSNVDEDQKQIIWTDIVMNAGDQFRQRVAWALSQLFAISPSATDDPIEKTEAFITYYDIFVRHAFGNFFDVLKEVSYSPMMAEMLTYLDSKSAAFIWSETGELSFADENFAREIMQLFTIGTTLLNMDGTPILDVITDKPILTYTNKHIMSFARAWTGFNMQEVRGNVELRWANFIDPLNVDPKARDVFPKIDLLGGYIGDSFPLCTDIPEKSFLRTGATYRLLGSSMNLELSKNPEDWQNEGMGNAKVLKLDTSSNLYEELCNQSTSGENDCDPRVEVILGDNIPCHGQECSVDTVRLVEVSESVFYEYIRQPCVDLSFYENPQLIQLTDEFVMCANPLAIVASEACCKPGDDQITHKNCEYADERVKYSTAIQRCQELDLSVCSFDEAWFDHEDVCASSSFHWHASSCSLKVKVVNVSGYVSIVHDSDKEYEIIQMLSIDSQNFFPIYWDQDFPNLSNNCGDNACETLSDGCLCNIKTVDEPVFLSTPLSETEIVSSLHIGSAIPELFDENDYDAPILLENVKIYFKSGQSYDMDTIFEVPFHSGNKYFKNVKSTVFVIDSAGEAAGFEFRNPPHFMSFSDQDKRDAYHETDAVLMHYFHHPNVAPFIAHYFIQRFGISNPSPRYVEVVANAFKYGSYSNESFPDYSFGTDQYGDLAATLAAVVLDRESRSISLDFDPVQGSLKEPLLKVIGYMRSMEYTPFEGHRYSAGNMKLDRMTARIGQMAHGIESVFSFFRREFQATGPVQEASLFSPEAQRYSAPDLMGFVNGVFSLTKFGLNPCYYGFGKEHWRDRCESEGDYSSAWGKLGFMPQNPSNPESVVDELSTLLTSGRLNVQSRNKIKDLFSETEDNQSGLRLAQQLISVTPEFHSTNLMELNGESRSDPEPVQPSSRPYKAIVFLNLHGGSDSSNFIVPHSQCSSTDMYAQYAEQRGSVAIAKSRLLKIDAGEESHVCDKFGIHPDLPALKSLYDNSDLSFFLNTGFLFEYVNKENWEVKTPTQLFAHNIQQGDIQRIDPKDERFGTGFLGRMADALTGQGYTTGSFSSGEQMVLNGEPQKSPTVTTVSPDGGVPRFNQKPSISNMRDIIFDLNGLSTKMSGVFGKTWSNMVDEYTHQYKQFRTALGNVDYTQQYPNNYLGRQLSMVSSIMQMKDAFGQDRQFFYVESGGWDTHLQQALDDATLIPELNNNLDAFVQTTKAQGLWDNVLVIVASEFGRTFMANSGAGTDHGWGGNYFMLGGEVKGGKIFGEYPNDLTEAGPLNLGRGRFIPTTSWDQIYNGVARWAGLTEEIDLNSVLPNRENFDLFDEDDLFN